MLLVKLKSTYGCLPPWLTTMGGHHWELKKRKEKHTDLEPLGFFWGFFCYTHGKKKKEKKTWQVFRLDKSAF